MCAGSEKFFKNNKTLNKTVLIDFSNIAYSSFYASVGIRHTDDDQKVALWRFFIFNSLLKIKNKFKPDEIVLAFDGGSWRKKAFTLYKAKRTIAREKSPVDYKKFFSDMDSFIEDLKDFPFGQIKVQYSEGDDIIAVLTEYLSTKRQEIIIVSVDKDLQQLQRYMNVKQWNPIKDAFVDCSNPYQFLNDHIIHGDTGDGIPNLLSDDDSILAEGKRQKRITSKIISEINEKGIDQFVIENGLIDKYNRNKLLIELSSETIPSEIQEKILYEYHNMDVKSDFMRVLGVLNKYNIKSLIDKVDQFL